MSKKSKLEESVEASGQSKAKRRREAIRLSREIYEEFVPEIMDWYPFRDRGELAHFVTDRLNSPELVLKEVKITYDAVINLVFGEVERVELRNDLTRIHWYTSTMLETAKRGYKEIILDKVPKGKLRKYFLPNRESLHDLIEKAIKELISEEKQEEAKKSIEAMLDDPSQVRQPSGLLQRVKKAYGYGSRGAVNEFLADLAGTPRDYLLRPVTGERKNPSNYHRKMFAVAAALEYAVKNGFRDKAVTAILERERMRNLKERAGVTYLIAGRSDYTKLLQQLEEKGIEKPILSGSLSRILGVSEKGASLYIDGIRDSMQLTVYLQLSDLLPRISIFDLRDESRKEEEYKRFRENYESGRVLVKTSTKLSPDDIKLLQAIRKIVSIRGGFLFVYPTPKPVTPEIKDLKDFPPYNGLFVTPNYSKIAQAFR